MERGIVGFHDPAGDRNRGRHVSPQAESRQWRRVEPVHDGRDARDRIVSPSSRHEGVLMPAPPDALRFCDNHVGCIQPDCVKEAEYAGFLGKQKEWRLTVTMMKAYVAMRRGVHSLTIGPDAPVLSHLLNQEWNKEKGDPYMLHEIWECMRSRRCDDPSRGEVYYYTRPADEEHLIPAPAYNVDEITAKNMWRNAGWRAANKKEDRAFNEWYPRERFQSQEETPGMAEDPDSGEAPGRSRSRVYARFMRPSVEVPPTPLYHQFADDDDWISDGEGHPEESRITPCTFAFLAAGCKRADSDKQIKPVIPKSQTPVRPRKTTSTEPPPGEKVAARQQRREKRLWRWAHPEPYFDEQDGELLWSPSTSAQDTSLEWSPPGVSLERLRLDLSKVPGALVPAVSREFLIHQHGADPEFESPLLVSSLGSVEDEREDEATAARNKKDEKDEKKTDKAPPADNKPLDPASANTRANTRLAELISLLVEEKLQTEEEIAELRNRVAALEARNSRTTKKTTTNTISRSKTATAVTVRNNKPTTNPRTASGSTTISDTDFLIPLAAAAPDLSDMTIATSDKKNYKASFLRTRLCGIGKLTAWLPRT